MSTTAAQNSRYPRPLKATHSFQQQHSPSSSPSRTSPSPLANTQTAEPTIAKSDGTVSIRFATTRENYQPVTDESIENAAQDLSTVNSFSTPALLETNKRSNSLSSLSENDLLAKTLPTNTHKRSNSLSNGQGTYEDLAATAPQIQPINSHEATAFSRFSVEGLNQEVSSALEGKSLSFEFCHPDGHIAPVNDIFKGGVAQLRVTTPITINSTTPTSPITGDISPSLNSTRFHRNSPVVMDVYSTGYFSSSPNSSFDHIPPPSAERCMSKTFYADNTLPKAPDRSKANIVFRGSVFSPLLPSPHSMEALTIS